MTAFMLALFSGFVRWLGLFRVRALNPICQIEKTLQNVCSLGERTLDRELYRVLKSKTFLACVKSTLLSEVGGDCQFIFHIGESASARARRQGTGVLERPAKRQQLMTEAA